MTERATLTDVLEAELLRLDPQTSGARAKAELITPAVLGWVGERMSEFAEAEGGRT
jgi:hypothetical protein